MERGQSERAAVVVADGSHAAPDGFQSNTRTLAIRNSQRLCNGVGGGGGCTAPFPVTPRTRGLASPPPLKHMAGFLLPEAAIPFNSIPGPKQSFSRFFSVAMVLLRY